MTRDHARLCGDLLPEVVAFARRRDYRLLSRWLERSPRLRGRTTLLSHVISRLTPSTLETTLTSSGAAGAVDPKLLEILVCPLTKGPLEYDADKQELVSRAAKLAYPIRDGIPIMLVDEARKLD